ncbi:MAG: hypothetical protein WC238_00065 [Parcubacteria group bacterium]|jgi:hypothetical protein
MYRRRLVVFFTLIAFCALMPVAFSEAGLFGLGGNSRDSRPDRNIESFFKVGKEWGEATRNLKPGQLNNEFVEGLKDANKIDYFNAHSDLKESFKKGFRIGFEDRVADLVLGPHLTAAAGRIGYETSNKFVGHIEAFESGWAGDIRNAINVFIVLISEGSQADRETFIKNFTDNYRKKYDSTQAILHSGGIMTQRSEGGTMLFLDYSKGKTLGALDIPDPEALKKEIYHQTFKVMGDESGKKLSTNLIRRDDLIELLRRSKTALEEVKPGLAGNLGIIRNAFIQKDSYGTDADNVFSGLIKDAGYTVHPVSEVKTEPSKAQQKEYDNTETIIKPKTKKKK